MTLIRTMATALGLSFFAWFVAPGVVKAQDEFAVGTKYYKWTDNSRIDAYYGTNEFREVHVQIWFPIDLPITNQKRAEYYPEIEKAQPFLENWTVEDVQFAKNLKTNSFVGVGISRRTGKFPLLIFSPSLGGHSSLYSYYAERLANAGYVVAGVNHKFESNYIITTDEKVVFQNHKFHDDLKALRIPEDITGDAYREKKGERHKVLGEDLIFVLNQLESINEPDFGNCLDLTAVGVWGHSVGGAASIDSARMDSRFRAVLNIDGTPSGSALREGLNQPFMFIEDLTDLNQRGYRIQFDRRADFCNKIESDSYRVLIGQANHNSFLDINYFGAADEKEKERALNTIQTSLDYMATFFDKYLRNSKVEIKIVESEDLKVIANQHLDIVVGSSDDLSGQTPKELLTRTKTACEEIRTAKFLGTRESFGSLTGRLPSSAIIEFERIEGTADDPVGVRVFADSMTYDHDNQSEYRQTATYDGKTLSLFDPQQAKIQIGQPSNLMDRNILLSPLYVNSINLLYRPKSIERLFAFESSKLPDSVVDGQFCHVLSFVENSGDSVDERRSILHIGKADFLPRRIEYWLDREGMPGVEVCTIRNLQFNKPVDKGKFTLNEVDGVAIEEFSLMIGQPAPEWKLSGLNGKEYQLKDARGSLVIIGFWSTWCAPCKEGLKVLGEIQDQYSPDDLLTYAINVMDDATIDKKTDVFDGLGLSLIPLIGDDQIVEQYQLEGLPVIFLIDKEGNVAWRGAGHSKGTRKHLVEVINRHFGK